MFFINGRFKRCVVGKLSLFFAQFKNNYYMELMKGEQKIPVFTLQVTTCTVLLDAKALV